MHSDVSKQIKRRTSGRNRAVMYMAAGQAMAFGLSLVLSRLYSPADFGLYLVFANLFSFCNIALTLRFEQAILYAKTARSTAALFVLSIGVSLAMTGLVFLALAVLPPFGWFGNGDWWLASLVAISALLSSAQRVITMVLTRWKRFAAIARMNLLKPGIVGLVQCAIGLVMPSGNALAVGHSLAYLLLLGAAWTQNRHLGKLCAPLSWDSVRDEARRNVHFPIYNMTQNLLFVASEAAIPLSIVALFGNAAGGLYWFAARVTTAPMQILVESLRPIIYRDFAMRLAKGERITARMRRDSMKLAAPFLVAAAAIGGYGGPLFALVFGAEWTDAASIAAVLLAFASVHAFAVPAIATLPIIGGQRIYLLVEVAVLALRLLAFWACAGRGLLTALAMSCVASACVNLLFFIWVDRAISRRASAHAH